MAAALLGSFAVRHVVLASRGSSSHLLTFAAVIRVWRVK